MNKDNLIHQYIVTDTAEQLYIFVHNDGIIMPCWAWNRPTHTFPIQTYNIDMYIYADWLDGIEQRSKHCTLDELPDDVKLAAIMYMAVVERLPRMGIRF